MRFTHTARWVTAGAAFGLFAALAVSGVAFAVSSSASSVPAPRMVPSTSTSFGGADATGYAGGGTVMGDTGGGLVANGGVGGVMGGSGRGSADGSFGTMGSSSSSPGAITNASLTGLVGRGEQGATIDTAANTVTYTGRSVTLVALASPHGKPNMTWEIDGLVNPTVVLQPGTKVDVVLANTDWGYMHGFELTTTPPPYSYMAMADVPDSFLLVPLPPRTANNTATASYYTRSASFTTASGTYYYLCPVPGHAVAGMFGKLVVL